MEVFEIKKRTVERQSSSASRGHGKSKIGYILAMAGIILFTSALLVVLHFSREYSYLTTEVESAQRTFAEKLEGEEELEQCEEEPFCNTKECVSIAATILESMNSKIDPCTDFYGYVCGRYPRVKEVPYGMDFYSPLKDAQLQVLIDIRKMMDGTPLESESFVEQRVRRFYASCMNTTVRNDVENRTLTTWFDLIGLARKHLAIEDDLDQGYIFESTLDFDHASDWTEMVSKLEDYGIHTLFVPKFLEKENAPPEKMELHSQVPFLNPEAYVNTSDDQLAFQKIVYREAMKEALQILKMDKQEMYEFIDQIFRLETEIATAILNYDATTQATTPELTEESKQLLQRIWRPVLGDTIQDLEITPASDTFSERPRGDHLQTILEILEHTPNKITVKYVFWRMLMQLMPHLGTDFRDIQINYMTKLSGVDYAYDVMWKQCSEVVRTELGMVATKMLMDSGYFKRDFIDAVNEQFLELKRDIALIFSTIEDLDENVAKMSLDKLKNMKLKLSYPDIFRQDEENWLNAYDGWTIHDDDHLMNVLNLKRFKWRKQLNRLWYTTDVSFTDDTTFRFNPVSRISLDDNSLSTTASYDYFKNTVHVGLGLLRPPLYVYSENVPSYLSYAYSSILAREMGRAFDFLGIFYDAEGNRFEIYLWPESLERRYHKTITCVMNQTESFQKGLPENAEKYFLQKTLNNIVVDTGSFVIPFQGLKAHLRSHQEEKPLPGISLTKKQTFFVQRAQMFCELRSKPLEGIESHITLPPKSRVNYAIANVKEFGEVFGCPADSPMTYAEKCFF